MKVSDQFHPRACQGEESRYLLNKSLGGPTEPVRTVFGEQNLLPLPGFEPENVHFVASRFFLFCFTLSFFIPTCIHPFPCSFYLCVKCPRTSPLLDCHACLAYSSTANWSSQPLVLQKDMQQAFGYNLGSAHFKWTYDDILFRNPEVTVLRLRLIPRHLHHVPCITAGLASALDVLINGRHVQPSAREQWNAYVFLAVQHRANSTGTTRYEF